MSELIPQEVVESRIFLMRGQKVMIDRDVAELFEVETKYLNRQVKRNIGRFPLEFMFQLSREEKGELVTICHRFESMKHSYVLPYAFNEHGIAMLAGVLKSKRAVKLSIFIVKTFIKLRRYIAVHKEFSGKLKELGEKVGKHDSEIASIFESINYLVTPPGTPKKKIGFLADRENLT